MKKQLFNQEGTIELIEGTSTPRGRIYDRNGKVIVDNEAVKTIVYKREAGTTVSEEREVEIC